MTDAFNNRTPVIAEESEKGDGWHIYSSRGDRVAVILGSDAEEIAKVAAAAINAAANGEAATESPAIDAPEVAPASTFPFRRLTPWDWFAGQALSGYVNNPDLNGVPATGVADNCAEIADAMMAERAKRGIA